MMNAERKKSEMQFMFMAHEDFEIFYTQQEILTFDKKIVHSHKKEEDIMTKNGRLNESGNTNLFHMFTLVRKIYNNFQQFGDYMISIQEIENMYSQLHTLYTEKKDKISHSNVKTYKKLFSQLDNIIDSYPLSSPSDDESDEEGEEVEEGEEKKEEEVDENEEDEGEGDIWNTGVFLFIEYERREGDAKKMRKGKSVSFILPFEKSKIRQQERKHNFDNFLSNPKSLSIIHNIHVYIS
jgi:hypothetical protein